MAYGIAGVNQDFCAHLSSLYPTFEKQVRLASYFTGYNDFGPNETNISFAQLTRVSSQASFPVDLLTPLNNQFAAAAGAPIVISRILTTSVTGPRSVQFTQLTVEEQVSTPVPGPVPLAGAALALSWSRRLRHRVSSR